MDIDSLPLDKYEAGLIMDSSSQTAPLGYSVLLGAGLQVTEQMVMDWCRANKKLIIDPAGMELDLRKKLSSRTQFLPSYKSVAEQYVTASLANTPLEFARFARLLPGSRYLVNTGLTRLVFPRTHAPEPHIEASCVCFANTQTGGWCPSGC